jgi:hypothetical protein
MKILALLFLVLSLSAAGCDAASVDQANIHSLDGQSTPSLSQKAKLPDNPAPTPTPTTTPIPKPKTLDRQQTNCDPNYSGCVPVASDVDCAGGKGNGPAYTGRVNVIGSDIYDLDRDGDGIACE